MDSTKKIQELKKIDLSQKSFTANGHEYTIGESISFERYLLYQKLEIEIGFGVRFEELFKGYQKIYDLCNKGRMADVAVIAHNAMNGVKTIDNRRVPILEMCALFINRKDEDLAIITQDMVDEKIKDWVAEGFDMGSFFQLGKATIKGYSKAYEALSLSISEG